MRAGLGAEGIVSKKVDGASLSGPFCVWIKVGNPASIAVQLERSEIWNRPRQRVAAVSRKTPAVTTAPDATPKTRARGAGTRVSRGSGNGPRTGTALRGL
jgi:hypothetical protein